ncbi:MAG TPA: hypothetical protein VMA73_14125 [Streptosporangiaceae bacterium]|nr:hypothetical protein [Streptosporangiaceae bacterium]
MTYRDSDEQCLPARPPQHAAPVSFLRRRGSPGQPGLGGWLGRLTRRGLRLLITFVAWTAGLGLVIGSIVLIATVADPQQAAPPLKLSPQAVGSSLRPARFGATSRSGTAAERYQVLATFSGHGDRRTAHFNVKAKLRWQLRWTYRCSPQADAAQFVLLRADLGSDQQTITTTEDFGASGHGLVWLGPSSHRHYLVVRSACSWNIKVMQAA